MFLLRYVVFPASALKSETGPDFLFTENKDLSHPGGRFLEKNIKKKCVNLRKDVRNNEAMGMFK